MVCYANLTQVLTLFKSATDTLKPQSHAPHATWCTRLRTSPQV